MSRLGASLIVNATTTFTGIGVAYLIGLPLSRWTALWFPAFIAWDYRRELAWLATRPLIGGAWLAGRAYGCAYLLGKRSAG